MKIHLLLGVVTLFLGACQTSYRGVTSENTHVDVPTGPNTEVKQRARPIDRKIIYDGYLRVVVKDVDSTAQKLQNLVEELDGYILEIATESAEIRIPAERLDEAMDRIQTFGKLRQRQLRGWDVTDQFTDLNLRLDNARKTRARYLELLDDATNVEDMLAIERELERMNVSIESMEGERNRLTELTDYASISVDFPEKVKLGPLGAVSKGIYEGIRWLFVWN